MQYLEVTKTETTSWTVVVALPDNMSKDAAIDALRQADITDNNLDYLFQADIVDSNGTLEEIETLLYDDIDDTDCYGPSWELSHDGAISRVTETTEEH